MRKISFLLLSAAVTFSACKESFKKGEMGLEYKIIAKGNGEKLKVGDMFQVHLGQYYNNGKTDSLMNDTRTAGGPVIESMDSASMPPAYFKILSQLKKGDSLVIRTLTDSAFAKYPDQMPPFFKKGHYLITTVRLINIFKTKDQADSARQAEMTLARNRDSLNSIATMVKDDKAIAAYLTKNNIKAVKAPQGTYVEIIQPGTGPNADTSVVVKTNYTGKTMEGKMFDSNVDPSKGHVEPFNVNMTNDMSLGSSVIKGWTDGLQLLNKGAKAKFYIPSPLAYGAQRVGEDIPANAILIFDIEVVDILSKEQAKKEIEDRVKLMKEKRKQRQDSIAKLKTDTTSKK